MRICEAQHITKYADQWCPACDEGLCSECENHHTISKFSRNHGVISIENYHKLPSSISEIGIHCEYHDMKYTHFSQHHDKPCCPDCIFTNHKDCGELLSIREIIKTSKTSTLIDNIEQNLTDIKNNNIDKIMKNRQTNLSEIRQQRHMFQDHIKQMRVNINSHLDTLEQNFLQELYNSYITTCRDKIHQTNNNTSIVTCYTMKGKQMWEYKYVSVLNHPSGITVDNKCNVYLTSFTFNTVVVVAPDGRQGRQIISSDVGLKEPTGLYFDKSKNCLLVTNFRGPAFLYHMC